MNAYGAPSVRPEMPRPLKAARILLVIGGVISVVSAIAVIAVLGADAEVLGQVTWSVWPGVAALVLARGLPRGGRKHYLWTLVVGGVWIFMGLGNAGQGDPRGFTSIIIPIVILVLVTRPASRDYLR
ncbi:hypothetical protein LWF15_02120 [Kineosporia rhizophila]|uniref:hypothetical protein n=1 Tax=Kineosporia TaxID=49184 RepID=UPI001E520951|nr:MULTISPECIES: hypothetical protein [Kineosporia]MCE0534295.1 hypothetical protein [Kineosporia rhizophila]GLY13843.1 hypothetical protein Kisp01_08590 [Kineosporia sp. NBRC 101677]